MICTPCFQDANGKLPPTKCALCGRTVAFARPGSNRLSRHRVSLEKGWPKGPWCRGKTAAPRGHAACKGCPCQHRTTRKESRHG